MRAVATLGALVGMVCVSCSTSSFSCQEPSDCVSGQFVGFCEVDGFCSFPDDTCPSGRRYGAESPSEIAQSCVPDSTAVSSGGPTSTAGTSTTVASSSTTASATTATSTTAQSGTTGECTVTVVELRVGGAQVPEAVSDFPLLVDVTLPSLMDATEDSAGLVFTVGSNSTALPYDVELLDSQTGRLRAWVSVPSLAPPDGGSVRMHVGVPDTTPAGSTEVWTRAGYLAVWHFEDLSSGAHDAAGEQPAGTVGVGISSGPGLVGNAAEFNGGTEAITVATTFVGTLESFTVSFWLRVDELPMGQGAVFRRLNGSSLYPRSYTSTSGSLTLQGRFGGNPTSSTSSSQPLTEGVEVYATLTYDTVTGVGTVFIDGNAEGSGTFGPGDPAPGTNDFQIGIDPDLSATLIGIIDEFRVSPTVRSDAWIQMSYDNQRSPQDFVSVSEPVLEPCP